MLGSLCLQGHEERSSAPEEGAVLGVGYQVLLNAPLI
jgi:hypothetical protein